jgi:2-hydroxychromene-2-carboxylate isomerase
MPLPEPIDFYFDFASPYGYIASTKIAAIAARHGRTVRWRPFLIGIVYKATHYVPLEIPAKKDYLYRDVPRHARFHGVPLSFPATFPEGLIAASRAVYWIDDQAPEEAGRFAEAAYRAYWAEGRKLADPAVVADLAAEQGIPRETTLAALNEPAVKDRLKQENEAAIARGVFGSPFIFVDGEPFWGSDRLDQIDRWLASGGW